MYIYHALIDALSAHMIHINLNIISCTCRAQSYQNNLLKLCTEKQANTCTTHTHTHSHSHSHARTHAHRRQGHRGQDSKNKDVQSKTKATTTESIDSVAGEDVDVAQDVDSNVNETDEYDEEELASEMTSTAKKG